MDLLDAYQISCEWRVLPWGATKLLKGRMLDALAMPLG